MCSLSFCAVTPSIPTSPLFYLISPELLRVGTVPCMYLSGLTLRVGGHHSFQSQSAYNFCVRLPRYIPVLTSVLLASQIQSRRCVLRRPRRFCCLLPKSRSNLTPSRGRRRGTAVHIIFAVSSLSFSLSSLSRQSRFLFLLFSGPRSHPHRPPSQPQDDARNDR